MIIPVEPPEFYTMEAAIKYGYDHIGEVDVSMGLKNRIMYDHKQITRLLVWNYKTLEEKLVNHKKAHDIAKRMPFYRRAWKIVGPDLVGASVYSSSVPWNRNK